MTIGTMLENVARLQQVVTYQDVVTNFNLPPLEGNWNSHPLSAIFEQLDQEDANKNRPFRTSVVVKKDKNNQMPGGGFFEALERLKGIACRNEIARQQAWINELNAAHSYAWT